MLIQLIARECGRLALGNFLILLLLVLGACAGSGGGTRPAFVKGHTCTALVDCRDRVDSTSVLETNELIAILDEAYWEAVLLSASSLEDWQQRVEDHKTVMGSAWWQEMSNRIDYCEKHCATSIGDSIRDVRWELVLRDGIPSAEWRAKGESRGEDSSGAPLCREIFVFSWHDWDREVVCASEPGGDYPTTIMSRGAVWSSPRLGHAITSQLSFAIFPNPGDSTFDLWVSSLTTGDQFTEESLRKGELYLGFAVFDSSNTLVGRDTLLAKLDLLRAFAGVTRVRDLGVMGYLSCRNLPRGEYTATLTLLGVGSNVGEYTKQVRIPSPYTSRGTSDLILIESRSARGENVVPGITRPKREMHVNPLATFRRGDTLHPYLEFRLPDEAEGNYRVSVVAIPIRRDRGDSKSMVSVGPIVQVEHIDGQIWGGAEPLQLGSRTKPNQGNEVTLLEQAYESNGPNGIFNVDLPLADIRKGRYWIAVRVSDDTGARSYGAAWTPIEVR